MPEGLKETSICLRTYVFLAGFWNRQHQIGSTSANHSTRIFGGGDDDDNDDEIIIIIIIIIAASVVWRWACWPLVPTFAGSKPAVEFLVRIILSAPSFGGEVKPSVPCRKFTACKRTQKWRGSRHFRQNSWQFLAHSSTFRCRGPRASFQTWVTPGGGSWNVLNHWSSKLGFHLPLATALCKNLPAENTQR